MSSMFVVVSVRYSNVSHKVISYAEELHIITGTRVHIIIERHPNDTIEKKQTSTQKRKKKRKNRKPPKLYEYDSSNYTNIVVQTNIVIQVG